VESVREDQKNLVGPMNLRSQRKIKRQIDLEENKEPLETSEQRRRYTRNGIRHDKGWKRRYSRCEEEEKEEHARLRKFRDNRWILQGETYQRQAAESWERGHPAIRRKKKGIWYLRGIGGRQIEDQSGAVLRESHPQIYTRGNDVRQGAAEKEEAFQKE